MSKLPTAQEIVAEFRRRVILFCLLGIVAGNSFIVLMVLLAGDGSAVLGIPAWMLKILAAGTMLGSMLKMLPLISCPSCGGLPSSHSRDIYPARCKNCGVRLR